jgi:RimJ/RimL family protein N-acetyltransferase
MPQIRLQPFSPEGLVALLESVAQCEERMGLSVAVELRDFYVSGEVSKAWLETLRGSESPDPWIHGFAVVEGDTIVGTAGFKGPPNDDGVVEIAYGIVPSRQGRGYATEAAKALVEFARSDPRVKLIRAHTLPKSNASTRVLTKCSFHHVGEVNDPDDGLVWRWERRS